MGLKGQRLMCPGAMRESAAMVPVSAVALGLDGWDSSFGSAVDLCESFKRELANQPQGAVVGLICTRCLKLPHDRRVFHFGRHHPRRHASATDTVDLSPMLQQQFNHCHTPSLCGKEERLRHVRSRRISRGENSLGQPNVLEQGYITLVCQCRTVQLRASAMFTWALAPSSMRTISTLPVAAAVMSGVAPFPE